MQKRTTILLPILALNCASLFGCQNAQNKNKTFLTYGDINIADKNFCDLTKTCDYDLSYTDLKNKIETKSENFLVSIADDGGCACWMYLSGVVKNYLDKTNTICYRMKLSEFDDKENFGLSISVGGSTFAIFKDGKLKKQLTANRNNKETHDNDAFEKFMNKNVVLPKMYYINEEDYENITTWNPICRATVYLSRSKCGDCQTIEPNVLKPYFESHQDSRNLYILDCQPIWKAESDPNYEDYLEAKDNLSLTEATNAKYGYKTGVFPTFLYWNNVTCNCGAVAYNETITKQNDKYIVTDTYYTNERKAYLPYLKDNQVLMNKEIPSNEINTSGDYVMWNKEYSTKYYKEVIDEFLDYVLPFGNDMIKIKNAD